MKPIFQTRFGAEEGNCFAAALASILEIPLDAVPVGLGQKDDCYREVNAFLRPMNLGSVSFTWDAGTTWFLPEDTWCILSGKSPRGHLHATVGMHGRIVHDPHPDGGGFVGNDREILAFVAIDPASRFEQRGGLPTYLALERKMLAAEAGGHEGFADVFRDELDPIWYALSPQEREWLDGRRAK